MVRCLTPHRGGPGVCMDVRSWNQEFFDWCSGVASSRGSLTKPVEELRAGRRTFVGDQLLAHS